ncbi:S-isoprenylcysteine methyltransferase [Roseivivax isoporae LMG 25204]|uniref:S-isoprenylcysteine methyltransferase n=1 Tax=Roseivivax isoporae LMG 25204 TaxID=1449351 RepID=X7F8L2_9RHOB|nr:S-isoprenylcysteine methyltransferase [Roseivivax isoporae LMG 25204]
MKWLDMPPVWLAAALLLAWQLRGIGPALGRAGDVAGGLLLVAALALLGLAVREFRRHRTTIVPHEEARALITTGIYARSRNPIYLADALILAGFALVWSAPLGLILVPVFVWIVTKRFIQPEEARLSAKFVAAFDAYAQQTNRWL